MAASVSKPSDREIRWCDQAIKEQKQTYQEWIKAAHHLRRMRALRLSGKAPRAFQSLIGRGVRVPMSWALVQTIVGMIAKNQPTWKRIPRDEGDRLSALRLATSCGPLIETYAQLLHKPLYYLLADQLTGDGKAVAKFHRTVLDGYPVWSGDQDEKEYNRSVEDYLNSTRPQPVRVSLIDPTTFWPSREEFDASYVVEQGRRPLLSTMKALGLKFGLNNEIQAVATGQPIMELELPGGSAPTSMVSVVTTEDSVFIDMDGSKLKFENEFGFINYCWRGGQVTSMNDPMLENVSVLFPFAGVEPWLNTLMSVLLAWSILGGTPILAVHTAAGQGSTIGEDTPIADMPLGKMVSPGVGKTLQFIQPPPVGREIIEAIETLMNIYEKAGVTSMRRGFIGTRTPGLTFGNALEAAGDAFLPLVDGLKGILEDIVRMTWRSVDAFDTPMWVTGTALVTDQGRGRKKLSPWKIDPKDIDGYYDIHADIKLSNLQDVINRGMHAAFMKGHELWSNDRAMEYGGVDDVVAERLEMLKDKVRATGMYQEQFLKMALEDDPMLGDVVKQAEAQGVPLLQLLQQGSQAIQPEGAAEGGNTEGGNATGGGGMYKGGKPPRGPAPMQGGRSNGMPRRPTGPRQTKQGQQF